MEGYNLLIAAIFLSIAIIAFSFVLKLVKINKCKKMLNSFIYLNDGSFNPEARVFLKEVFVRENPGNRGLKTVTVLNKNIYNRALNNMLKNGHSDCVTVSNMADIIIGG